MRKDRYRKMRKLPRDLARLGLTGRKNRRAWKSAKKATLNIIAKG